MTDYLISKTILLCLDRLGDIKRDYRDAKTEIEADLGETLRAVPYGNLIDGYIAILSDWRTGGSTANLTERAAMLINIATAIGLVPYLQARKASIAKEKAVLSERAAATALLEQTIKAVE